jgi:hypothetical protein
MACIVLMYLYLCHNVPLFPWACLLFVRGAPITPRLQHMYLEHNKHYLFSKLGFSCQPPCLLPCLLYAHHAAHCQVAALGLEPHKHLGKSLAQMQPHLHRLRDSFGCNVCGEGGEYETLTLDCPAFTQGRIVLDSWEVRGTFGGGGGRGSGGGGLG